MEPNNYPNGCTYSVRGGGFGAEAPPPPPPQIFMFYNYMQYMSSGVD